MLPKADDNLKIPCFKPMSFKLLDEKQIEVCRRVSSIPQARCLILIFCFQFRTLETWYL